MGAAGADRAGAERRGDRRRVARRPRLGAASSSCSYAAIAIAKSLFQKGASAVAALAFQFASTNLVWELGLVLWILIGWQFALAEYVGGIVLIGADVDAHRAFVSRHARRGGARPRARRPTPATSTTAATRTGAGGSGCVSASAWSDVAHNFRGDWQMLWKEITIGFLLAGFIALLGDDFFNFLFVTDAPGPLRTIENVVAGPLIAVAELRLLDRQRATRGRALVGRDLVRRRARLHLRGPDRAADHASRTASTTARRSRCG